MRIPVIPGSLAVCLLLVSGCLQPNPPATSDPSAGPAPPVPFPPIPADLSPYTALLCAGDAVIDILAPRNHACNTQVTTHNGPAAETTLAVNPLDPMNLVGGAKDFTLGEDGSCGKYNVWSGVYWSRDGGRTWGNGLLPGHPKDTRRTPLSDYACGSDPVVAFAPDGVAYYVSLMYVPGDPPPHPMLGPVSGGQEKAALAVSRSFDGGETWEDAVLAVTGSGLDKEWIAIDRETGQVYISFIGGGVLQIVRSDDKGLTWTEPVAVVTPGDFPDGPALIQMAQVGVGPGHLVHYIYWAVQEATHASGVYHKISSDEGQTWSDPGTVDSTFVPLFDLGVQRKYRTVGIPALAVDAEAGTVYVAYPSRAPDDSDVLLRRSEDAGVTWSDPVKVNDDGVEIPAGESGAREGLPTNDQWMVAIALGPDASLHATWIDYRDDPQGQQAKIYHSYSTDEGRTWSANAPLSDVAFDGTGGYHQEGAGTIGDYMGLAVSPLAAHALWADTRHARNDVFTATLLAG